MSKQTNKKKQESKDLKSKIDELESKIKELENEVKKNLEGWQRARADYQNLEKEILTVKNESRYYGQEDILEKLIPILENFNQAMSSQEQIINSIKENLQDKKDLIKKLDSWKLGIDYINKQFQDLFNEFQIEVIKSVGEEFNPEYHEAVETVNDKDEKDGIIVKEIKKGYIFRNKVLIPAKVVVNKLEK